MNLAGWESTLQFGVVYAMFALSVYAALSTGVLSLASIASGAVGGFLFAWAAAQTGISPFVVLLMGTVAGGVFGYLLAFLFVRLSGHYLAMASITVLLIANVVVLNMPSITGGVMGKSVPQWYGWGYLLGALALFGWVFHRLGTSRLGLAAAVVREDPLVAAGVGINPAAIRRIGFFLAGLVGGTAGVLFANQLQYIDPETFYTNLAFISLASVVLGSAYRWPGAVLGGIIFTALPQFLSQTVPQTTVQIIYGAAIVAIMIFLPAGLYDPGRWMRGIRRLVGLPSEPSPAPARQHRTIAPDPNTFDHLGAVPAAADSPAGAGDPPVLIPEASSAAVIASVAELPDTEAEAGASDVFVLEARGVTKTFGGLNAVDDMMMTVAEHQIFGILGPNGAGKTTFINLLSGVLPVDRGEILLLGSDVTRKPAYKRAERGLARTYQNIRLSPGLSTLETILAGAFVQGHAGLLSIVAATPAERRERRRLSEEARELMHVVGLTTPPERHADTLSYGDQRRVEIARALASHPKVLLLDEPTAGMNYAEAAAIGNLLRQVRDGGQTVILIEHNIRLVAEYCDRCIVMHSGRLLAEGRPIECLSRPDAQEAYFGRRDDAERIQALRLLRAH